MKARAIHQQQRASRQRQRGLAIVELTIALPLLLFLFIATAEVGRLLYQYNTLTKAQLSAVRFLAMHASEGSSSEVLTTYGDQAKNLVLYGRLTADGDPLLEGVAPEDISVTFSTPDQTRVRVDVSYPFSPALFNTLPTFGLGDPIALQFPIASAVEMRALRGGS